MATGSYLSVITLNVNGLNAPTKRQRLAEWIQQQDPDICCLQETHLNTRDTYRQKVEGWKKIFHANRDQNKAGVAILTLLQGIFPTQGLNPGLLHCRWILYQVSYQGRPPIFQLHFYFKNDFAWKKYNTLENISI